MSQGLCSDPDGPRGANLTPAERETAKSYYRLQLACKLGDERMVRQALDRIPTAGRGGSGGSLLPQLRKLAADAAELRSQAEAVGRKDPRSMARDLGAINALLSGRSTTPARQSEPEFIDGWAELDTYFGDADFE